MLSGLVYRSFKSTHLLAHLVGQEDLNMSKASVNEDNYISVDKDKLKEEQKAELKKAQEAYE